MITQDINVTFQYSAGAETKTLICSYVVWNLEVAGAAPVELLDFTLDEIHDDVRQAWEMQVKLDLSQAEWMANFIAAKDKELIIDGTTFEVVNGFQNIEMPLFGGSKLGVHPKLKFRRKQTGILSTGVASATMNMHHLEATV